MENAAQVVMECIFQVIQSLHSTHPITVHNLMDRVDSTAEVRGHCRKAGHDQTCSARQRERDDSIRFLQRCCQYKSSDTSALLPHRD